MGERFRASADNLLQHGYTCRVRASDSAVTVLVAAQGKSVCELALREGTTFGSDQLDFTFAWPRLSYNGINGTVSATWDPDAGQPALLFHDYTAFGSGNHSLPDADALFAALWEKIIRHLENTHR
ncbi:hypothetical protein [Actinokineospora globicatena]|uniref:Uncharacterized protein n=1 Tax=Actinokineospora globicatena TaxID=103729 RepID=A0A9W6QHC5_9PSEU|nr:hypothetical protein [Actinokineospora globicatena]GLW89397.1 hypothetical protein Aglo03_02130 [Actinokineospora globicatena]